MTDQEQPEEERPVHQPDAVTGPGGDDDDEPDAAAPAAAGETGGFDVGALLGGPGGGGLDLGALMAQASQLQDQLAEAQAQAEAELAAAVVVGAAGGRAVEVEVTGDYDFRAVRIDPSAVDPDDVELLQDLVLAALRDAVAQVDELREQTADSGLPDLPDLGGLLG